MSQAEGTITKDGVEYYLCLGGGEELSLLDQDKNGIQILHGCDAGIGMPSRRHRTKKGAASPHAERGKLTKE